jgi:hypothetical protein
MHWFTADDGTRFLIQTPLECAHSLAQAFPAADTPVTSRRFMAQVRAECPPPERGARRKPPKTGAKTRDQDKPDPC